MKKILVIILLIVATTLMFALDLSICEGHALLNDGVTPHAQADFGFTITEYPEITVTGCNTGQSFEACKEEFYANYTPIFTYYFNIDGHPNNGNDVYAENEGGYFLMMLGGFVDATNFGYSGSSYYNANGFQFFYDFVNQAEITYYGTDGCSSIEYLTYIADNHTYDLGNVIFGDAPSNNPNPPTLVAPANGATDIGLNIFLDWNAPAGNTPADYYKVTINGTEYTNIVETHYHPTGLSFNTPNTWSVVAVAVDPVKGHIETPITSKKIIKTNTRGDSQASSEWTFTTQDDPGNGSQGSQTGQGGNNGNNTAPATVDIPPMADGNGGYVDPDVTVDPDDPQTITVSVTVNNENGAVPNPSGVGLSYDVTISGAVGTTVQITLSYEGMNPIPTEIIYFDGNTYQPVPDAVFGETSVTFPWTISGSRGEDTFVVNNGQSSTLPVELSSFEATFTNENYVNLVWTTQSETDFMGFDVLRSSNENVSDAIKVNATLISGTNSSQENTYNFLDKEVELNQTYYYWLRILNNNGSSEFTNPRAVSTFGNNDTPDIPKITKLGNAYPNPFNPETHINFAISENSHVNLSIYNVLGQKVKTFYNEEMAPGNYSITWKGLDSKNMKCSSGIYFYRLQTNNYKSIKKMLLLK